MMKYCKNEILENSDSNSAPIVEKNVLTEQEQKDEINRNYLPNLSEYQQITYDINTEKGENKVFYPNVNYQDESKKGYYIFYNNNLSGLKEFYSFELNKLKDNNSFVLFHIKEFLDKLDIKYDAGSYYNPFRLLSKVVSYGYQPIVDKARTIANNLIDIQDYERNHGTDIRTKAFEIKVKDDKEKIFDKIVYIDKPSYPSIETNFCILPDKYKDTLSYIIELEKLLNNYMKELGENIVEQTKKNKACFILNRASFYLSHKEKLREQYKLDVLLKLDKLRRKIDYLLLQHRFKFEESKRPILNINIGRCIILINSLETTSIYVEKTELQKFITELGYALERKAQNLKEKRNFEVLSLDEIREIAQVRDININSNEAIREAIQNTIDDLEEKKQKNKEEIRSIATSLGMEIVGDTLKSISGIPPVKKEIKKEKKGTTDGEPKKEGMDRISELQAENRKIEKKITNYKNRLERLNVNQNYDIEFINIMKLYTQLIRRNYHLRNDFSGIILSEKRKMALVEQNQIKKFEEQVNLREYEIKEISKDV